MSCYKLGPAVNHQLDGIYEYRADHWGEGQADNYLGGLFGHFDDVAAKRIPWRPIPAEFGVDGYMSRFEHHFVYWKVLKSGEIGFAALLHERMHQIARIHDLF